MENILILDTETTAIVPEKGELIEIAGIYFNVPSRSIIQQVSTLYYSTSNAAEHINHISVDSLKCVDGQLVRYSELLLENMMINCDAIVAHNAIFDRGWIKKKSSLSDLSESKTWFCSRLDIDWGKTDSLKLVDIAYAMGVPVISAHRALSDCQMLAACFQNLLNLDDQIGDIGNKDTYEAIVDFNERHMPKSNGFSWNPDKKKWLKKMTTAQAYNMPFGVVLHSKPV